METIDDRSFKEKAADAWGRVKLKASQVADWAYQNKELLLLTAPFILGSGLEIAKMHNKSVTMKEERELKENYVYDRRKGHYCETKRKLKSSEMAELDRRYDQGENMSEILRDMRLAK